MDIREMLLNTKLFSSLEDVVDIVAKSEQRKIAPHTFLIKKGPIFENEFYFLIDGILEVISPKGEVVNILRPGVFVGESVVFSEKERIASIKTAVESTVLVIPVSIINELAEENATLGAKIYKRLHEVTISYLKRANLSMSRLIKDQRDNTLFIISIISFLSLFAIAVPYLSENRSFNPQWVAIVLTTFGSIILIFNIILTKSPLSKIGITTHNLKRSLIESFAISVSIIASLYVTKLIVIHFTSSAFQSEFFQTLRDKILPNNLLVTNDSTLFFDISYALGIFFQEVLVRGGLQGRLKKFFTSKYRSFFSIALTSLIFSSAHSYFGGGVVFVVFITSLFWGWLYNRQRNIFGVTLSHEILGMSMLANNWWLVRRFLDG